MESNVRIENLLAGPAAHLYWQTSVLSPHPSAEVEVSSDVQVALHN